MAHSQGIEIKGIKQGDAEDLSHEWINEDFRRPKPLFGFKTSGRIWGGWVMRALLLVVVFPFLFGCGNGEPKDALSAIKTRLDQLDKRLTQLEDTEQKIARLESQVNKLERSISKMNRPVASRVEKGQYHMVRQGDSLFKIAKKHGITVKELCRINKITSKSVIRPGQKLLVAR